jgi:hypothetical protein
MKKIKFLLMLAILLPVIFNSCKEDDVDPKVEYPVGSIVWKNDTTLTDHFVVPLGKSLYIEPGVTVVMDNIEKRPELIVLGNLYSNGTSEKPVKITVAQQYRNKENRYSRYWGGIICGYESGEVLLDNTIIEYAGAQTTEESASFQYKLFKTETGEGVPGFHFCNVNGKFVIKNCIFRNNAEDHIYITGGKSIIMSSKFYHSGFDGGEAINYKSGCLADIANNLIYDANTNAFKLSNNGALEPQAHLFVYNNTVVNTGWRRPKIKGGSIWLEYNVRAEVYNNLVFDCRHAVKEDAGNPRDTRSVITPNFYFASTQAGVDQLVKNEAKGILQGDKDLFSASAGDKNPNFTNFTIQSNVDIMAGVNKTTDVAQDFNENWDFSPKAGSPVVGKGVTNFTRHFGTNGIEINGVKYTSPEPSTTIGAFPVK